MDNPSGHIDVVCFGELLWDMLPGGKIVGGAPFNIAHRIDQLGLSSHVVTAIGRDPLGEELLTIAKQKVNNTSYIQVHDSLPTSVVNIHISTQGEPQYEIAYPVAWDDIRLTDSLISLVQSSRSLIYSSLAMRDPRSRSTLLSLLPHAQLKICDINLRQGHYQRVTIMDMIATADILRMNEDELAMISQWLNLSHLTQQDQIIQLYKIYGYQEIIATLGSAGALSYDGETFLSQDVYPVDVVDTVGAGDGFLAAYITCRLNGLPRLKTLQYACAVGSLTASKKGGTPLIKADEITQLLTL